MENKWRKLASQSMKMIFDFPPINRWQINFNAIQRIACDVIDLTGEPFPIVFPSASFHHIIWHETFPGNLQRHPPCWPCVVVTTATTSTNRSKLDDYHNLARRKRARTLIRNIGVAMAWPVAVETPLVSSQPVIVLQKYNRRVYHYRSLSRNEENDAIAALCVCGAVVFRVAGLAGWLDDAL